MAGILRGDIYWVDLGSTVGNEQAGFRPVLIISLDAFNKHANTVVALAITSQPQHVEFPLACELKIKSLPKKSWVKISQIRTLSQQRLKQKIAHLSTEEVDYIVEGLNEIIGG